MLTLIPRPSHLYTLSLMECPRNEGVRAERALIQYTFDSEQDALHYALDYVVKRLVSLTACSLDEEEIETFFGDTLFDADALAAVFERQKEDDQALLTYFLSFEHDHQHRIIDRMFDYLDDDDMEAFCHIEETDIYHLQSA